MCQPYSGRDKVIFKGRFLWNRPFLGYSKVSDNKKHPYGVPYDDDGQAAEVSGVRISG